MPVDVTAPGVVLAETTRWVFAGDSARPRRPNADQERVESRHAAHLVAVAPDGTVACVLGDPERVTFLRSAVKPFQAAASLELADVDLPDELVAVGWSSHRGEPAQLHAVTDILARAGLRPEDLTTPEARPLADPSEAPSRLAHNCSGKHALFALAGHTLGISGREALLAPTGPVQRPVLGALERTLGSVADVAIDGCGAPAVAAPLVQLARAFAAFADHDSPWARIAAAGRAHPELVGGDGRLETALLSAGVLAKPGAEGVFGAGWRDAEAGGWGVACKAEDGASRAASAALHGFLVAAGVVPAAIWEPDPVLGGGQPAGSVRATRQVVDAGRQLLSRRK